MKSLDRTQLRRQVMGCWLGKAVGGTLGVPVEGWSGPLNMTFYDPVPTQMLPNDDLDLQVLWACVLDKMPTVNVDRMVLGQAWLDHVAFPWDEYGVAIRNLRQGIKPPFSGSCDNWFTCGMGAAIRSEIWACLAAGDPALAAAYAYEDACTDHAGEGIWAEVVLAAMESLAFVESDLNVLLDRSLPLLPVESLVRCAIEDTRRWYARSGDWKVVRELIVRDYGHENFTDVTMNLAFTVLGLLEGQGDFSKTICTANNCGMDTDCTAATAGALMGILNPDGIEERWLKPIGRDLVINKDITGISPPATLDGFTDLVLDLRDRLNGRPPVKHAPAQATPQGIDVEMAFGKGPWIHGGWQADRVMSSPSSSNGRLPNGKRMTLPGTLATLARDSFEDEVLLVRYAVELPQTQKVCVMLNCPQNCRLWIDGELAFGRECGRMSPSFHRVPINQSTRREMSAGRHELVAAIARPQAGVADASWVIGIADNATNQWLPGIFVAP